MRQRKKVFATVDEGRLDVKRGSALGVLSGDLRATTFYPDDLDIIRKPNANSRNSKTDANG